MTSMFKAPLKPSIAPMFNYEISEYKILPSDRPSYHVLISWTDDFANQHESNQSFLKEFAKSHDNAYTSNSPGFCIKNFNNDSNGPPDNRLVFAINIRDKNISREEIEEFFSSARNAGVVIGPMWLMSGQTLIDPYAKLHVYADHLSFYKPGTTAADVEKEYRAEKNNFDHAEIEIRKGDRYLQLYLYRPESYISSKEGLYYHITDFKRMSTPVRAYMQSQNSSTEEELQKPKI